MFKKFQLLLIGIFFSFSVLHAQSFDEYVMQNRFVSCVDVNYNAAGILKSLLALNDQDSLYSFLHYWQRKCGNNAEYTQRLKHLLDIKYGRFTDEQVNESLFNELIWFRRSRLYPDYRYNFGDTLTDFYRNMNRLETELRTLARSIEYTVSIDAALILDFYSSDSPTFANIKAAPMELSKLRRLYEWYEDENKQFTEWHMALSVGYYQPSGNLSLFGDHSSIGFIYGLRKVRNNFDFVFDVRIGPSKNSYTFVYQGSVMQDDTWTGIYVGGEYTYDIVTGNNWRLGLSGGLGYEGITALYADNDFGDEAKILPSYNVNGGLVIKRRIKQRGQLALHVRYNSVDHKNVGGTRLDGEYLNIRLVLGFLTNPNREYRQAAVQ